MKSGLKVLANKLSIGRRQSAVACGDLGGACDLYQPALMLEDDEDSAQMSLDGNGGAIVMSTSSREEEDVDDDIYKDDIDIDEDESQKRRHTITDSSHGSSSGGGGDGDGARRRRHTTKEESSNRRRSSTRAKAWEKRTEQQNTTRTNVRDRARRRSSTSGIVFSYNDVGIDGATQHNNVSASTAEAETAEGIPAATTRNNPTPQRPSVVRERRRSSIAGTTNHSTANNTVSSEKAAINSKVEEIKARAAKIEEAKRCAPPRHRSSTSARSSSNENGDNSRKRMPPRRTKSTPESGMLTKGGEQRPERQERPERSIPRRTRSGESSARPKLKRRSTSREPSSSSTHATSRTTTRQSSTAPPTSSDSTSPTKPETISLEHPEGTTLQPPAATTTKPLASKIRRKTQRRGSVACDGSDFGSSLEEKDQKATEEEKAKQNALAAAWRHKRAQVVKQGHLQQDATEKNASDRVEEAQHPEPAPVYDPCDVENAALLQTPTILRQSKSIGDGDPIVGAFNGLPLQTPIATNHNQHEPLWDNSSSRRQRRSSIACSTPTARTRNLVPGNTSAGTTNSNTSSNWMDAYNQDGNAPPPPTSKNTSSSSSHSRDKSCSSHSSGHGSVMKSLHLQQEPSPTAVVDDDGFFLSANTLEQLTPSRPTVAPPSGIVPNKPSAVTRDESKAFKSAVIKPSVWQGESKDPMWTSFSDHGSSAIKSEEAGEWTLFPDNDNPKECDELEEEEFEEEDSSEYEEDLTEPEDDEYGLNDESETRDASDNMEEVEEENMKGEDEQEDEEDEEEEEEEEEDVDDKFDEKRKSLEILSYGSSHSSQISPCPVPGDDYSVDADLTVTWSIYQQEEEEKDDDRSQGQHMNAIEEVEESTSAYDDEEDDLISALPMPRRTTYKSVVEENDAESLGYGDIDIDMEKTTYYEPGKPKNLTQLEQKLGYNSCATGMTEASTIADSVVWEDGKFRNTCDSVVLAKVTNQEPRKMPIGRIELKEASWKQKIPQHYADAGGIDEGKPEHPWQCQDDMSVGYESVTSEFSVATPQLTRDRISRRASMGSGCTPFQHIFGVPGQDRPSSNRRESPAQNQAHSTKRKVAAATTEEEQGAALGYEELGYGTKGSVSKNDLADKIPTRKVVPRRRHSMYSCVSIAEGENEEESMHSKKSKGDTSRSNRGTFRRGSIACDRFRGYDNTIDE